MKKLLAAMLAMAMLLSAAALAEPEAVEPEAVENKADDVTGIWYMREMIMEDGTRLNPDTLGMEFTIELIDDSAAILTDTRGAYQQVDKGVWTQEGNMVSIVIDDDFSILMRREGDSLTAERSESHSKWVFSREVPDDIYEPAPPVVAALDDYAGRWTVTKVQVAGLYYDADMLGANPGAMIVGDTLTLTGGMPFGKVPVTLKFADGMLAYLGADEEPEPILTPTPEPTATPSFAPSPTPTPEISPTPTFEPTPTPTPGIAPTPEPEIVYGDEGEDGEVFVATAEPTPSPTPTFEPTPSPTPMPTPTPTFEPTPSPTPFATPTPTPVPTVEPRLRTTRYDITAQLLEDDTLSLTVGLDSETLVVFILRRGY